MKSAASDRGLVHNLRPPICTAAAQLINAALDDPEKKARLADLGGTPLPGSPAEFGKLIADETEKWGKVIRASNINPQG